MLPEEHEEEAAMKNAQVIHDYVCFNHCFRQHNEPLFPCLPYLQPSLLHYCDWEDRHPIKTSYWTWCHEEALLLFLFKYSASTMMTHHHRSAIRYFEELPRLATRVTMSLSRGGRPWETCSQKRMSGRHPSETCSRKLMRMMTTKMNIDFGSSSPKSFKLT